MRMRFGLRLVGKQEPRRCAYFNTALETENQRRERSRLPYIGDYRLLCHCSTFHIKINAHHIPVAPSRIPSQAAATPYCTTCAIRWTKYIEHCSRSWQRTSYPHLRALLHSALRLDSPTSRRKRLGDLLHPAGSRMYDPQERRPNLERHLLPAFALVYRRKAAECQMAVPLIRHGRLAHPLYAELAELSAGAFRAEAGLVLRPRQ